MNEQQFKPLPEQVSERMLVAMKAGNSIFQKPVKEDGTAPFLTPYNAKTGKSYTGATAITLLMRNREDPRWMTAKQAAANKTLVMGGAKGTLINFMTDKPARPVIGEGGQPELKANGKPKTEYVKVGVPEVAEAWLFNGDQLKGLPDRLEAIAKRFEIQPPVAERVNNIFANSGAVLVTESQDMPERTDDMVIVQDRQNFVSDAQYFATALHEMAHWAGADTRLNLSFGAEAGSENFAREELRTNIASLLLGAELNLGNDYGDHSGFQQQWAAIMEKDPNELFRAADDAQKIVNFLVGFEPKLELKQGQSRPNSFTKGEIIPYNNTDYKILEIQKNKTLQVEDMVTGMKTKVDKNDGLYASLMNARENSQEQVQRPERGRHDDGQGMDDRQQDFDRGRQVDNDDFALDQDQKQEQVAETSVAQGRKGRGR